MSFGTILLAEDEEDDVILIQRIFRRLAVPYSLEVVTDGQEAINYLEGLGRYTDRSRFPFPSMLILDRRLPKKSGEEVSEWLKAQKTFPSLFVVTLTGASQASAPQESFERHGNIHFFNCFFLKPINEDGLTMIMQFFESWQRNHAKQAGRTEG